MDSRTFNIDNTWKISKGECDKLDKLDQDDIESDDSNDEESDDCDEDNKITIQSKDKNNHCIFCKTPHILLYESKICKCSRVYFCKICLKKNNNSLQKCPQCKSDLKLKIEKERINAIYHPVYSWNNLGLLSCLGPVTYFVQPILFISIIAVIIGIPQNNYYKLLYLYSVASLYCKTDIIQTIDTIHTEENLHMNLITSVMEPYPSYSSYYDYTCLQPYTVLTYPANQHVYYVMMLHTIPQVFALINAIAFITIGKYTIIFIIGLFVTNIIKIIVHLKYIIGSIIGYVVASVFTVSHERLVFRGNAIHWFLLIIFANNNIIFCKILLNNHISNQIRIYAIAEIIFNFICTKELCTFFKYINDTVTNRLWKGIFYCDYNTPNEEEYYLFGVKCHHKWKSFYFGGNGIYGRICIMIAFAIIPLLSHIAGYYIYIYTRNDNLLLVIGNIGNMILFFRIVIMFLLFTVYEFIKMMFDQICFTDIEQTNVHDENISLVESTRYDINDYGAVV